MLFAQVLELSSFVPFFSTFLVGSICLSSNRRSSTLGSEPGRPGTDVAFTHHRTQLQTQNQQQQYQLHLRSGSTVPSLHSSTRNGPSAMVFGDTASGMSSNVSSRQTTLDRHSTPSHSNAGGVTGGLVPRGHTLFHVPAQTQVHPPHGHDNYPHSHGPPGSRLPQLTQRRATTISAPGQGQLRHQQQRSSVSLLNHSGSVNGVSVETSPESNVQRPLHTEACRSIQSEEMVAASDAGYGKTDGKREGSDQSCSINEYVHPYYLFLLDLTT
ncbi:unnamed protein product [Protopolystoma xenopodis]|uniref:Uncharacterized protein n=1 Tax=Protopolystoma xenopodis TaxID=117903 RepID=A0A448X3Q7_9PLAT|nr:unnamed protein product [Protopolystoma xenopodis]